MNKSIIKTVCMLALSSVFFSPASKAQEMNPIPVAGVVLDIAPDARAGGMGDAGVATAPDVYSQHWNVSKYAFHTRGSGVAMSYTPWMRKVTDDIALMNVVGFWKPGKDDNQAISASLSYFKIGDIKVIYNDSFEGAATSFQPYEMAFDIGYSRQLSKQLSLGVALRYIRLDYSGYGDDITSSDIISADISTYWEKYIDLAGTESLFTLGANISNLTGSKVSFDGGNSNAFIPTNLRIGASLMYPVTKVSTFSFSLDMNKLLVPTPPQRGDLSKEEYNKKYEDYLNTSAISGIFKSFGGASFSEKMKELMWSFGVEYDYDGQFKVRSGYFYENKMKGNRQYFSFGAGFRWNLLQLDAAYMVSTVSNNPLDQTLRLSLAFDIPISNRFYSKK